MYHGKDAALLPPPLPFKVGIGATASPYDEALRNPVRRVFGTGMKVTTIDQHRVSAGCQMLELLPTIMATIWAREPGSEAEAGADRAVVGHHLAHDLGRHDGHRRVDEDVIGLAVRPMSGVGAAPHSPPETDRKKPRRVRVMRCLLRARPAEGSPCRGGLAPASLAD